MKKMKFVIAALFVIIVTVTLTPHSAEAVMLDIDSTTNQLLGAKEVDVVGTTYDVEFQDGSCDALFNNCTAFTFTDQSSALSASQALLDQVFTGVYDIDPELTHGIESLTAGYMITPFGTPAGLDGRAFAQNRVPPLGNRISILLPTAPTDTANSTRAHRDVYAVWTATPTPIPEPSSVFLVGSGLLGLVAYRKKRRES
jgi:PEP-CTERM motif